LYRTSAAIREIFAELRRTLGSTVSAKELLNFAFIATNFFNQQSSDEVDFEDLDFESKKTPQPNSKIFEEWPIDLAMRDGGWQILEYEYHQTRDEFMDYGIAVVDTDFLHYQFPAGTLEGDMVMAENLFWLDVDKCVGQSSAAPGWAIDELGTAFYTAVTDTD
jgi:hypothetical protein